MQITGLQHDAELDGAFPVIREKHQDLEDDCCRDLIPKTRAAAYRMFAVREEGCGYVAPARGRERGAALRFYKGRMGYERPGYSIRKASTP